MGLKASTQPGVAYKPPELSKEHQHLLNELPKKYIQTTLVPEEELAQQKRQELYLTEKSDNSPKEYFKGDLECLKQTEHFESGLIKHIFNGDVKLASAGKGKKRLEATGYHTEVIKNAEGQVVPGTKSIPDAKGVYQGKVTVKGVRKRTMGGMSTFFPAQWSPQRIVNAVNEAYKGKSAIDLSGKVFYGYSKEGVKIKMRISPNGKISSAFPIMEEN